MTKLLFNWVENRGKLFGRVATFLASQEGTDNYIDMHHYDVEGVKGLCLLRGSKKGAAVQVAFEISPQGRPIGADDYFQSQFQPMRAPNLNTPTAAIAAAPLPYGNTRVPVDSEWEVVESSMLAMVVVLTEDQQDGATREVRIALTEDKEYLLYVPPIPQL